MNRIGVNTVWKMMEKVCTYIVTFTLSIIIARILDPSEYGLIAMVTVFITIADVFVSNGLGIALVQSKEINDSIYSSVLYFNVMFSLALYIVLYFVSPSIASFYKEPQLTSITRVLSIRVVFGSIRSILDAYLTKQMAFKKMFYASFVGSILSAIVGIILAYTGYGVWTLVIQSLLCTVAIVSIEAVQTKWKPKLVIEVAQTKKLFSFGWKLLVGALIETIGNEISQLIIGKKYTSEDLAYYNRGQSIPKLIAVNITNSIATVVFPIMTEAQDNKEKVLELVRRSERMTAYIVFPIYFGIYAVAPILINTLLGDKWMFATEYLQLYCIVQLLATPNYVVQNAVCAIGRSDLKLYMDVIRKAMYLLLLFLIMGRGVKAIAIVDVIITAICVIMVMFFANKYLKYSIKAVIMDHMQVLIICGIMYGIISLYGTLQMTHIAIIALQVVTGIAIYVLISKVLQNKEYLTIRRNVLSVFKTLKKDDK